MTRVLASLFPACAALWRRLQPAGSRLVSTILPRPTTCAQASLGAAGTSVCAASLLLLLSTCAAFAADWPTGNRMTPPTIDAVQPQGVARGATLEMTVEGLNLANASQVYFSQPGIQARILRIKELPDLSDVRLGANGTVSTIDLGPLPPRNQVTIEIDISPDAPVGPVNFRLQTPLGTTPEARFLVEPYYGETPDKEPNDNPEDAFETYAPTILVGAISKPGDLDYYKIHAKAGQELTFENGAVMLGSALQPVIGIYDANQNLVRQYGEEGGRSAYAFAHKFDKAGVYYVRVADYQESGSARNFYRIKIGNFPLVTAAFPLGVEKGKTAEIALSGFGLGAGKATVEGKPSRDLDNAVRVRPKGAFNELKLPIDDEPSMRVTSATAPMPVPAAMDGKLTTAHQDFRFKARKAQKLVFEVQASRVGSPLDSLLEILDTNGKPVERATIRSVLETSLTLRDHDSAGAGLRLSSVTGFEVGDLVMVGAEILQLEAMPRGPDDDTRFLAFGGQRLGMLDTTPEAHAMDQPMYKIQVHPAGAHFAPNGLPVVHLAYRNDDGGPGFGKDSRLRFTAPADGDYILRLRDVRGEHGDDYAYRVIAREPRPDFRLSVTPKNPNVPQGGRLPITVTALRMDDFDGPIEVRIEDLPAGLTATTGVIAPGEVSTTLLLRAEANQKFTGVVPLKVSGTAQAGSRALAHLANPDDRLQFIAVAPKPDIEMTAETKQVVLQPGGTAEVKVSIRRNNGFGGRVPVEVRNLPPGVLVTNVGLNGVLINENENERTFTLHALPIAQPIAQPIVLSGKIETRSDAQQTTYASEPVPLSVKPSSQAAGKMAAAAESSAKK